MLQPSSTTDLLRQEFTDLPRGTLTEAELLAWLSDRVADLMQHRMDYLRSLCYTLDLPEDRVRAALDPWATAPNRLARILYERQRARAETKRRYPTAPLTDEDAW